MSKFKIKVPGKLNTRYGQNYYAVDKKGQLVIVGDRAPNNVLKRYGLWFTEESAEEQRLYWLPREFEEVSDSV